MTGEYAGIVAAVTGGGAGIGQAVVAELTGRGAVVAARDVHPPDGETGVFCDVTDRACVDTAIATVVERFGGLDVLVNNAGISAVGTVEDLGDEAWHRVLDVNVVGVARVSAAAGAAQTRTGAGGGGAGREE